MRGHSGLRIWHGEDVMEHQVAQGIADFTDSGTGQCACSEWFFFSPLLSHRKLSKDNS